MQLKRSMDLTPYDIPRIESPFLAASETRRKINAGQFREQELRQLLRLQPYDRADLCELTVNLVAAGDAFLVHGPLDEGPLSPVVIWRENPDLASGGEWKPSSELPFGLSYPMQDLNASQLTPQDIKRGPFCMDSPAPEAYPRPETDESRQHQPRKTPSTPESGASVMATTIAGINSGEEAGEQKEEEPEVHVEVGIFADGTLNNAFNSQLLAQELEKECHKSGEYDETGIAECRQHLSLMMGSSYRNTPSNVAKLWELYPDNDLQDRTFRRYQLKVYGAGVGTETGEGDSLVSAATGMGDTGTIQQVVKIFQELALQIEVRVQGKQIHKLVVDIFGFSRGAAAARHAIYEINRKEKGIFGKALHARGLAWPKAMEVRFVGLFDSVAAILNIANGDLSAANDNNAPVRLFLDPEKVTKAVQLTAEHEHRKLFALNSLCGPDKKLPPNFREIKLPGAHSDIGGGYPELQQEDVLISPLHPISRDRFPWPQETMQWDNLEALKKDIESEGWIGEYSLPVAQPPARNPDIENRNDLGEPRLEVFTKRSEHPGPDGRVELALRMYRSINGGYSRVALALMHRLAKQSGVIFTPIPNIGNTQIPEELTSIHQSLQEQIDAGANSPRLNTPQLNLLMQRYIHYSAHYNSINTAIKGVPLSLRILRNFNTNMPEEGRRRTVYFNTEKN
ncbi:MAG: DUF2235 domain-containing protein [Marinobacter sp.]